MEARHGRGEPDDSPASRAAPVPSEESPIPAPDDARRAFAALGSQVRLRILRALAVRPMSLPELGRELDLKRPTLRYHLAFLQEQGWVREAPPDKTGESGRPATRYRAAPHAWVGFPERHFELLGEIALRALLESAGPDRTAIVLRANGRALPKHMAESAAVQASLTAWSPEAFERIVLGELFRGFGVVSAVVSRTPAQLTYRVYTCPFLELAEKMPGLVCDAVDAGFHDGIDRSMGDVATAKRACMGHGDPYCEYRITWSRTGGAEAPLPEGREEARRRKG